MVEEFVWLLFSQHTDGLVSLRAICTTSEYAERRCDALIQHESVARAWVEKAGCNHLLYEGMFEYSTYGKKMYAKIYRKTGEIVRQ